MKLMFDRIMLIRISYIISQLVYNAEFGLPQDKNNLLKALDRLSSYLSIYFYDTSLKIDLTKHMLNNRLKPSKMQ